MTDDTPNPPASRFIALALGVALVLYLFLALSGVQYGLPHAQRPLSYDPDETTWLEALSRLKPGHYNLAPDLMVPTFYLECYGAAVLSARALGYIPRTADKAYFRDHPEEFARFYLVGRYLQIFCGVLLLLLMAWVAGNLFGAAAENISVLLLAITPSLIAVSHFSQASLPVTLLSFFALSCILMDAKRSPEHGRWILASSFFAGLAISTKYSALPLLAPIAYQCAQHKSKRLWLQTALAGSTALFIGIPFAFLAPHSYWLGFKRIAHDNLMPVPGLLAMLEYPIQYPFRYALGGFLEAACGIAVVWHLFHRSVAGRLLLIWVASFLAGVLAAGSIATPARVLIVVPSLLLLLSHLMAEGIQKGGLWKGLTYGVASALFLATLLPSLAIVALRHQRPLQEAASEWIESNIPPGSRLGIPRTIYWWTPDIVYASAAHPERLTKPYRVKVLGFSKELTGQLKPEYIIVSQNERQLCLGWPQYAKTCLDFLTWLDSGQSYRLIKQFPRDVHWKTWRWNRPEQTWIFDDDLWVSTLSIYRRR